MKIVLDTNNGPTKTQIDSKLTIDHNSFDV